MRNWHICAIVTLNILEVKMKTFFGSFHRQVHAGVDHFLRVLDHRDVRETKD
jgi:hypothetical protein